MRFYLVAFAVIAPFVSAGLLPDGCKSVMYKLYIDNFGYIILNIESKLLIFLENLLM